MNFSFQWARTQAGKSETWYDYPIAFPTAIITGAGWQSNREECTNVRVNKATLSGIYIYCHGGIPDAQGYIVIGN